jgi:hypothetical protein
MVLGALKAMVGLIILSTVFSFPIIALYLLHELVWPKLSPRLSEVLPE